MLTHDMVAALCVTVKSLTLGDALEIFRQMNQSHLERRLYVENPRGDYREFRFSSLGEDARNCCAHLTTFWSVWYECGPPSNREWMEGTLCQFVADCLLLEIVVQGEKPVCDIVTSVVKMGAP